MKYNFGFETSAKVSSEVLKEMIKTMVEEQTGNKVKDINFNISKKTIGYGTNESDAMVFEGATISFETNSIILNSQANGLSSYHVVNGSGWHGEADEASV